jgi:hypothetical protein
MADPRKGREGSRWYNERPSGEAFGEWFKTVPIHDGLNHEDYISGITLIQQKEKGLDVIGFDPNGQPQMVEAQNLVYVPYAKVDTRVTYWEAYLALHPEWVGVIEPVTYPGQLANNRGLPPGFFPFQQQHGDKETRYVGCSMRARVLDANTVEEIDVIETGPDGKPWRRRALTGKVIKNYSPGTKIVACAGRYEADHFSVMKAETGAIGRALGMAGMLVIPGSGVATAEDMQEAAAPSGAPPTPDGAALPADIPTAVADQENDPAFLRDRIGVLLTRLQADHPDALKAFQAWARDRGFTKVEDLSDVQVKGVVKKLEKVLDDAGRQAADAAPALAAEE